MRSHMMGRGRTRIWLPGTVLFLCSVAAQAGDVVEYYHLDAIGNVRAVTNEAGQVIERHDYLPYGEECTTGPCAANLSLTPGQPKRFTGKERDTETGFDYFGARYYGSRIGRFTTVDPVYTWRDNLVDPQRWNRYAYARNNPLRYTDPDGRQTAPQPGTLDWIIDQFNRAVGLNSVPNVVFQEGQAVRPVGVDKETVKKAAAVVGVVAVAANIVDRPLTSDAARREAMRQTGIPTSQEPVRQTRTKAGMQYIYEIEGKEYAVTQQTTDRVEGHRPHWEAGQVKPPADYGLDPLGRVRVRNEGKAKVEYEQ